MAVDFPRLTRYLFFTGLLAYGVTAWNSHGYHQEDEHFQILEPAVRVLEGRSINELPWEFPARMRPTLQVYMAAAFSKIADSLGMTNRFDQVTLIRLILALASFLALWRFTQNMTRKLDSPAARFAGLAAVSCLWFMPYLHCRFSSELMSALAFIVGLNFLFRETGLSFLAGGFMIGASFWLRFQTAFMIMPFSMFLLFARPHWHEHFGFGEMPWQRRVGIFSVIVSGAVLCSAIAICADRLFYGTWVLTPWHYLSENILQGKSDTFGVAPWWGYFRSFFKAGIFPIALLLFVAILVFIVRRRFSFIAWILVSFVVIHSLIGHKELRFIFPLAAFLPAVLAVTFEISSTKMRTWPRPAIVVITIFFLSITGINFTALFASALLPAEVQVKALKDLARIGHGQNILMSGESRSYASVIGNPFRFFARDLPPDFFAALPAPDRERQEIHYMFVAKEAPAMKSSCTTLARSWWPDIPAHLPEDSVYRNRFASYLIQKCPP